MKTAESRTRLPSLTQAPVSLVSGLFYCRISLPGPLCWPPPPQQLLPPYPSSGTPRGAGVHLTEKTSCPGPRRMTAQLSVRRMPSKRVRVPDPLGSMAMNYGRHIPIGLGARESQRVSPPLHPQAAFPLACISAFILHGARSCVDVT